MARGRNAIQTLAKYRQTEDETQRAALKETLMRDMPYFGYGYLKNADEVVPSIPICFYAFRIMVGLGCLFILFFAITLFFLYKKDIKRDRWLLISAIVLVPLAYIASESGWMVAEMGRQPWTIQDMLPTSAAVSDISATSVATTFFIFLVLFTTMLAVEISIMLRQIKRGPEEE